MNWAQRLKRVFAIDIEACPECGGKVRVAAPAHPCARGISASMHVIACIEHPPLIRQLLTHVQQRDGPADFDARRPPGEAIVA